MGRPAVFHFLEKLLLFRRHALTQVLQIHPRFAGLGEHVALLLFFLFDMMLDLFRQHLHLGIKILVVGVGPLDLADQDLGAVMLDIGFVHKILIDTFFPAAGIEHVLLDLGVNPQLKAYLVRQSALAAGFLCLFELPKQPLDLAMVGLEQGDSVRSFLRRHGNVSVLFRLKEQLLAGKVP